MIYWLEKCPPINLWNYSLLGCITKNKTVKSDSSKINKKLIDPDFEIKRILKHRQREKQNERT